MSANIAQSAFPAIEKSQSKIWRYMDFPKFISLLVEKKLYFSRADKLGDAFEGSYSKKNIQLRSQVYKGEIPEKKLKEYSRICEEATKWIYINCWHINQHESDAMWKLYGGQGYSIAIQSTCQNLISVLPQNVSITEVEYVDYIEDWISEGNLFYPFAHKRNSFSHEQELRAMILDSKTNKEGLDIAVDLSALIEDVFISPSAPDWFEGLVKNLLHQYTLRKAVKKSSLVHDPVY